MNHAISTGYVSPSDIALIADVSRGAVSNWRKRSSDFPQMVSGTPAKPLFARDDVMDWLRRNGRITDDKESRQRRAGMDLWAAVNVLRGRIAVMDIGELVLELAVARREGRAPDLGGSVGDHAPDISSVESALSAIADEDLARSVDYVLQRIARAQVKGGAESGFIGSRTSEMLARLAANRPGGILYDPACGIASALIGGVELGAEPHRVIGHDINEAALRIARQRAILHGVPIELVHTDVLGEDIDPGLRADTIVLEPPYGMHYDSSARLTDPRFVFGTPPRTSSDTAWLQHAVTHLADAGRAYVLSPSGTVFRGGAEAKIRADLVRQGCVEAIISLPGKLLPHVSIPLTLWVLRRPVEGIDPNPILMIDATEVEEPEAAIAQWLVDPRAREEVPSVEVSTTDVLAADANLSPQRYTNRAEPDPDEVTAAYQRGWADIMATTQAIAEARNGVEFFAQHSLSRIMTVGELVDEGVIVVRRGKPKDRYDDEPDVLRARIISAGNIRDGSNFDGWDLDFDPPQHPDLTEPGEVLVTTMNEVCARVDEYGDHLVTADVYRLRIAANDVLSSKYLAFTLTGSWNSRFMSGATIKRVPVRDLEVPILPIDQQERLGLAGLVLDLMKDDARKLVQRTDDVRSALLDAIRYDAPLKHSDPIGGMNKNADEPTEGNK